MEGIQKDPEFPIAMIEFSQERDIQYHRLKFPPKGKVVSIPSVRGFVNRTLPVEFPPEVQRSIGVPGDFYNGCDHTEDDASVKDKKDHTAHFLSSTLTLFVNL
jgi:hypothetical protein